MYAGAMIFLGKQNIPNRLMQLCKRADYLSKEELLKYKDCVIDLLDEREIYPFLIQSRIIHDTHLLLEYFKDASSK